MTETTITATEAEAEHAADPMAAPMHAALQAALGPYLEGDLDPTADLVEALLGVLAAAEPTPGLISTLHLAVTGLTPTPELMGPMHHAVGAALCLHRPAQYTAARPAQQGAPRISASASASRPGSIAAMISRIFAANPGTPYRVGDLVRELGDAVSGGGAVGAALNGMVSRGEAVLISTGPKLYLSAHDAAGHGAGQGAAPEPDAPATTPETPTTAPADASPASQAPDTEAPAAAQADADGEPAESDAKARTARRGRSA